MGFVEMGDRSRPMTNCKVRKINMSGRHEAMAHKLRPIRSALEDIFEVWTKDGE